MEIEETFTVGEAARLSGLTIYMVNYLCREKVLEPSSPRPRGRGRPRAYTFGDVVVLRALGQLLQSGISVANLKRGLEDLRERHPEITPKSVPLQYLVTDGRYVFFRHRENILEALDGSGQFVFAYVVELEHVKNEVLRTIQAGGMR